MSIELAEPIHESCDNVVGRPTEDFEHTRTLKFLVNFMATCSGSNALPLNKSHQLLQYGQPLSPSDNLHGHMCNPGDNVTLDQDSDQGDRLDFVH